MKSFAIRKANHPMMKSADGKEMTDEEMKYEYATGDGMIGSPAKTEKP